jgi:transcriptional repressor NrdR
VIFLPQKAEVTDTRKSRDNKSVKRRRTCKECDYRFTTVEKIQIKELFVIKKSGSRRSFDPSKITKSILTATRKRNISQAVVDSISQKIIKEIEGYGTKEISTAKIGDMILNELSLIDKVAYIRFASVYKEFNSAEDFLRFIVK